MEMQKKAYQILFVDRDEEACAAMAEGVRNCSKKSSNSDALDDAIARLLPKSETKFAGGLPSLLLWQAPVKVAIIGLGNFLDLEPVRRYVDLLPPHAIVMTNGAHGASLAAEAAARGQGLTIHTLPLDWPRFGRKAVWWCNRRLVECADRVALFWDQRNREALSLVKFAQKLRKPTEFYPLPACPDPSFAPSSKKGTPEATRRYEVRQESFVSRATL
jgi:hypothetical protein